MKQLIAILFIPFFLSAQVKIPARIEAEGYSSWSKGVNIFTLDSDKGLTLKTGSWASYYVNITTAGTYVINFRVGDGSGGAVTRLLKSDGTVFGRFVTIPTGNLTTFSIVSDTVFFASGKQTFRLSDSIGQYNIDWFDVSLIPTAPAPVVSYALKSDVDSLKIILNLLKRKVDSSYIKADARVFGWTVDSLFTVPSLLPSLNEKRVMPLKQKKLKKK